jgi:SAM-dependent methyltransferase
MFAYTGKDECLRFFTTATLAADPPLNPHGSVLEIGCAEADWLTPARKSWPGMRFTGVDWRDARRPGCTVIRGDILAQSFIKDAFDTVVLVSALEHIGLGHYDKDPAHRDGDSLTLQLVHHWLKPGGWLWIDVPWNVGESYTVCGTKYRVYDDATITSRLDQGLGWDRKWTGWSWKGDPALIPKPDLAIRAEDLPRKHFYIQGMWWQKTTAPAVAS